MKNPNHYGTVTKLKGNRRRPWVAKEGLSGKQKAIGYAASKAEAMILLAKYNNLPWDIDSGHITLQQLYDLWVEKKSAKIKPSTFKSLKSAYNRHVKKLAARSYCTIKPFEMQETIDYCGGGASLQRNIKWLWSRLDKFAVEIDLPVKKYSDVLTSDPAPSDTSRTMFSNEDVKKLWDNQSAPWVDAALFLLYTGLRATEFCNLKVSDINTEEWYLTGGIKTEAGIMRIVPIHTKILPIVKAHMANSKSGYLFEADGQGMTYSVFKNIWDALMVEYGLHYNPHECRHTFRSWLDSANGNQVCIDRLMGHVSQGTGRRVYTHKTIIELRKTIELITK